MSTESEYTVGYGKPPQHSRFPKGRSGNPKGRPKGSTSFTRLARRIFDQKITVRDNGERRSITKLQAALTQLANKAAAGDPRALRDVLKLQPLLEQEAGGDKITVEIVRFADRHPATPDAIPSSTADNPHRESATGNCITRCSGEPYRQRD